MNNKLKIASLLLSLVLFCMCPMSTSAAVNYSGHVSSTAYCAAFTLSSTLYGSANLNSDGAAAASGVDALVSGPYHVMGLSAFVSITDDSNMFDNIDDSDESASKSASWADPHLNRQAYVSTDTASILTANYATSGHGVDVGMLMPDGTIKYSQSTYDDLVYSDFMW